MTSATLVLRQPNTDLFSASLPCEKVTQLRVVNYGSGTPNPLPVLTRVADVYVPGCKAGDILTVESAFQATNTGSRNIELTGRLIFTPSQTSVSGSIISHAGKGMGGLGLGFNITPAMHHGVINITGSYRVPFDCDGYVAAVLYGGDEVESWLTLDTGGHLNVIRNRGL